MSHSTPESLSDPERQEKRLAVVLTGSVGRGAFQAGALTRVLRGLEESDGLRPSILLGTSAGAINAVAWANRAGLPAAQAGAAIEALWRGMSSADAYRRIVSLRTAARVLLPGLFGWFGRGPGIRNLLDTAPLGDTLDEKLRPIEFGERTPLDTVGVVATWMPPATTTGSPGGRSVLFLQERRPTTWPGDSRRALDVERCDLTARHVRASAAVPAAFPAEELGPPEVRDPQKSGFYVDGGVRLNSPLNPAIKLGATHVVLVSAMSLHYPGFGQAGTRRRPSVDDAASQVMHAVTADRAVEDLLTVLRTNRLVDQAGRGVLTRDHAAGEPYRCVAVLPVAPEPGRLGRLADEVWRGRYGGFRHTAALEDNAWLGRALRSAGDGAGRRDVLSYLLFDPEYFSRSIEHGEARGQRALDHGWLTTEPLTDQLR